MRTLQLVLFVIGVLAFFLAVFFVGDEMGDTLWRTGVAFLLVDLVVLRLWPAGRPA